MINKSSGLDMEAASDFKLLDRAVVDSLNAMPERLTFQSNVKLGRLQDGACIFLRC